VCFADKEFSFGGEGCNADSFVKARGRLPESYALARAHNNGEG
jgi:hypothetical protein